MPKRVTFWRLQKDICVCASASEGKSYFCSNRCIFIEIVLHSSHTSCGMKTNGAIHPRLDQDWQLLLWMMTRADVSTSLTSNKLLLPLFSLSFSIPLMMQNNLRGKFCRYLTMRLKFCCFLTLLRQIL